MEWGDEMLEFKVDDEMLEKVKKFHPNCKKKYTGAIGGGEYYKFMQTGLGLCVIYVCKCGKELHLTDTSDW